MSRKDEVSGGKLLLGIGGAVLAWRYRSTLLDVVVAIAEQKEKIVLDRANNTDAYDAYVLAGMRPNFLSKSSAEFWHSLNLTTEEKARITKKIVAELAQRPLLAPPLFNVASPYLESRKCSKCGAFYFNKCGCCRTRARGRRGCFNMPNKPVASRRFSLALPAPQPTKSVDERARELVVDLHQANPQMKPSDVKAFLKPLIAEEFKPSKKEKPKRATKHVTPAPVRERIWLAWRKIEAEKAGCTLEELDNLNERSRATRDDWMKIVRVEYPNANWDFVSKVRSEIYEYKRLKRRAN
jgi:hypothetical protein